jgi:predicted acylesterase/phospholipase RssA
MRPSDFDLKLVLGGGGALGAYQPGVYEALHEAGLRPGHVCGASIGAVNGVLIAGNEPGLRVERLRRFWELVAEPVDLPMGGRRWPTRRCAGPTGSPPACARGCSAGPGSTRRSSSRR